MKQLTLFVVFLLINLISYGQKVADTHPFDMQSIPESIQVIDGFMGVQRVIDAEGKNQDEIYQLLSRWIAQNYKRGDYVTDLDSKISIILKGNNTMMVEYVKFGKTANLLLQLLSIGGASRSVMIGFFCAFIFSISEQKNILKSINSMFLKNYW